MPSRFEVHPENPQARAIRAAADSLRAGQIVIYPTDSCYAIGWGLDAVEATDQVRRLRGITGKRSFTVMCADLAMVSTLAKFDNSAHRLMKSLSPGPYTFLLPATREVPRRLLDPKRRIIGVRVAGSPTVQSLLAEVGGPFMTSTLQLPEDDLPISELDELPRQISSIVDVILDSGAGGFEPSTIIDLTTASPALVRPWSWPR